MRSPRRVPPRRRWSRQRADDEAASEVVATTLLVVMSVTLLSTFGATVVSTVTSETPTPPVGTFSVEPQAGEASVSVTLVSGSRLTLAGTTFSVQVNGSDRTSDVYVVEQSVSGKWSPGEALHVNLTGAALTAAQRVFFIAVDKDSGKSIGMANAPVPAPGDGTPVHTNVIGATLSFDRAPLVVDGKTTANASVAVTSSNGLVLLTGVVINLSAVGGPGALSLHDDGVTPDATAGDGTYVASFSLDNYTFSSLPGHANLTVGVNVTDVLGTIATDTETLWIASAPTSKVRAGAEFRDIGASSVITSRGYLNLSAFTFRDTSVVDNDQIEVRVSDLADTTKTWSALVTFKAATGGCTQPSIVNVVIRRDNVAGSLTYTPDTCFTIGTNAKLNLANVTASLDNSTTPQPWAWTVTGSEATLAYANASIGPSNEAIIAFFGDTASAAPSAIGLGQADLSWAPPVEEAAAAAPSAPRSLSATAGAGSVALSWVLPATGGGTVTNYHVYVGETSGDTTWVASTGDSNTTFTVNGLTNGVTYFFNVTAQNSYGQGTSSSEVSATPSTTPGAPTGLAGVKGNRSIALSWTAPASTGGSAITNYYVYLGTSASTTYLAATGGTNTSFTANGLTNGQLYYFNVTAVNANGQGASSSQSTATPSTVPNPPASLVGTAGVSEVTLSWTAGDNGGSALTNYHIYRGLILGSQTYLAATGSGANVSYVDATAVNGILYYYNITTWNANGQSASSNTVSATPSAGISAPSAPQSLTATRGNQSVSLSWSAPASNGGSPITNYYVYVGTGSGNVYTAATGGSNTTFVVNGLTNGQAYLFNVTAVNLVGQGASSNEAGATPATLPYPPTALSATAGNQSVSLSWTAPANNGGAAITNYHIYRGTASGGTAYVASTGGSNTSFVMNGLTNGQIYYFNVTAVNSVGQGASGNEASATPVTLPNPPASLAAAPGDQSVTLTWSIPSNGGSALTTFKIYRGTESGATTFLASTGSGANTSFVVNGLTNGVPYFFNVTAVNAVGESASSNEATAMPAGLPSAPQSLSATKGNKTVSLSWSAPASNGGSAVTNYNIYRGTGSGNAYIASTGGTNTSFVATGLTNGQTYYFNVTAVNANGQGTSSSEASATPSTIPYPPTSLSGTAGNQFVALSWSAPGDNGGSGITDYNIYRGTESGATVYVASTGGSNTTFNMTGLTNGQPYFFNVTAVNANGQSAGSNEITATPVTTPSAPQSLSATKGNGSVSLSWSAPSSNGGSPLTNYRVYQGTTSGGETALAYTGGTNTSFVANGLTNGQIYWFYVAAVNAVGEGPGSAEASATPSTVPNPPTALSATLGNGSASLSWTAPASNGGSAITTYNVYRGTGAGNVYIATTGGTNTSFVANGLTNGVAYFFNVTAVNANGQSAGSNEATVTPASVPYPPSSLAVTNVTAGQLNLSWTAGSTGGSAITAYQVWRGGSAGGETLLATIGTNTSYADLNIVAATTYYYQVRATNAIGTSNPSNEVNAKAFAYTYASTTTTDLTGGTITNAANFARDNGGDVATLTETGATTVASYPTSANDRHFNTTPYTWALVSSSNVALSFPATGGNPGGAMLVRSTSGTWSATIENSFTLSAAASSAASFSVDSYTTGGGSITFTLVKPGGGTVTLGTNAAGVYTTTSATVAASDLSTVGSYILRVSISGSGNAKDTYVDNIWLNVPSAANNQFGREFTVSGIPTGGAYTLEVRARQLANAEGIEIRTGAGALLGTISSTTMATYSFSVTPSSGSYVLRLIDAITSSDATVSTWEVDYIRVVTS